jgi:hypothetical protein
MYQAVGLMGEFTAITSTSGWTAVPYSTRPIFSCDAMRVMSGRQPKPERLGWPCNIVDDRLLIYRGEGLYWIECSPKDPLRRHAQVKSVV